MENQDRTHSLLPITAVVMLAGVGTYFFFPQPFTSLRPEQPQPFHRHLASTEDIDARLWEDPFKPVHDHEAPSACREWSPLPPKVSPDADDIERIPFQEPDVDSSHDLQHLGFLIRSHVERSRSSRGHGQTRDLALPAGGGGFRSRLVLMPVMVPGEPYAEQAEKRRRIRHAVHSGLSVSGFVPRVGQSIGFVETCWDADDRLTPDGARALRVPFEWFSQDLLRRNTHSSPEDEILVLWLDEGALGPSPLVQVEELLRTLVGFCFHRPLGPSCLTPADLSEAIGFRLIGPATSGSLLAMVGESAAPPEVASTLPAPPAPAEPAPPGVQETAMVPGEGGPGGDLIAKQTELLLDMTEWYLDTPEEWLGGQRRHRPRFETELRQPVAQALDRLAEPGARPVSLSQLMTEPQLAPVDSPALEAVETVATALAETGASVKDSDEDWAATVAMAWVAMVLDEGDLPQRWQPETFVDQLVLELCQSAWPPEGADPPKDLCPSPTAEPGPADETLSALSEIFVAQWKDLESWDSSSPEIWDQWTRKLVQALWNALPDDGRSDGPGGVGPRRRIEQWVLLNRNRLYGSIRPAERILPALQVYSSRATAAPALLLAETGVMTGDPQRLAGVANRRTGVGSFVSTAVTDEWLAKALVEELDVRGVDLCGPAATDHVALVGEWDTFYSRSLTLALEAAILRCRSCREVESETSGVIRYCGLTLDQALRLARQSESPPRVHRFHYLRGLDGSLPAGRGGTSSGERRGTGEGKGSEKDSMQEGEADLASLRKWRKSLERAIGPSQFDYMRRLAHRLAALDEELRGSNQRLAAVGVVGSDVYDKLLVLQALRPHFSRSLFFTTDLDARLCHPAEYKWTRNLLVASGFGLSLAPTYQDPIPPFRDTYQTSTFLAVRLALSGPSGPNPTAESRLGGTVQKALLPGRWRPAGLSSMDFSRDAKLHWLKALNQDVERVLRPRVFEIARTGPYDLSAEPDLLSLHPAKPSGAPRLATVVAASGTSLLAIVLLASALPGLRRLDLDRWTLDRQRSFLSGALALTVLTALVVIGLVVWLDQSNGRPEPFELGEGISVWPTEGLRLLAALLSLSFLLVGWAKLRANEQALERSFGLVPAGKKEDTAAGAASSAAPEIEQRRGPFGLAILGRRALFSVRVALAWLRRVLVRATRPSTYQWNPKKWEAIGRLQTTRNKISVNDWRPNAHDSGSRIEAPALATERQDASEEADAPEPSAETVRAQKVWTRYRQLGRLEYRIARLVPMALIFSCLGPSLIWLLGTPHKPFRGAIAQQADWWILIASILGVIVLTLFVVDATRLCERFIRVLVARPTGWPLEKGPEDRAVGYRTRMDQIIEERGLAEEDASPWADLELIGERTEVVGRLIFYPFVILAILLLSRNRLFDNWDWPPSLVIIFLLASACAVASAVVVRRAAEEARSRAEERLRINRSKAIQEENQGRAEQLKDLLKEVEEFDRGAFAHWSKHPVIKAVLLPFGGLGALALLELLSSMGL